MRISISDAAHKMNAAPAFYDDGDLQDFINRFAEARARGFLNKSELLEIAKRKSPRRIGRVQENNNVDVEILTKLALGSLRDPTRIRLLTALDGIGVPTASAILSWIFPDRYAVVDQRAWASLQKMGLLERTKQRKVQFSISDWQAYQGVVAKLAKACGRTPQKVDIWLYNFDKPTGVPS